MIKGNGDDEDSDTYPNDKLRSSQEYCGRLACENYELRADLNSEYRDRRKDAIKKVIANMTVGKDVSGLFPDVLKNMQTEDLEQKKLVYLYLMNYAKTQPELVILAVNTFVKILKLIYDDDSYEALRQMLKHPTPYHFILPVRNIDSSQQSISQLKVPDHHKIELFQLDLESFESVKSFASEFLLRSPALPINRLILNAGAVFKSLRKSVDGLESTFQINHLSNFLLIDLLIDRMLNSGDDVRIVLVNSSLHIKGTGAGEGPNLEYDNLDGSKVYDGLLFYKNSKLSQMLFCYQLDKILKAKEVKNISVIALSPGFVPTTGLTRDTAFFKKLILHYIFPYLPFTRTPEQGGEVIVYAATSDDIVGKSAIYIDQFCNITKSSEESYDEEKQKQWWNISCDLTGLVGKKL
ncbi:125_t:CDS:2 [Entrophospora sp. SA101]|nr:125_t:CDS:2 [Entrophospora sp. SA101]